MSDDETDETEEEITHSHSNTNLPSQPTHTVFGKQAAKISYASKGAYTQQLKDTNQIHHEHTHTTRPLHNPQSTDDETKEYSPKTKSCIINSTSSNIHLPKHPHSYQMQQSSNTTHSPTHISSLRRNIEKTRAIQGIMGYAESEKTNSYHKWKSMIDRNICSFMAQHPKTFIRRLKRGIPPMFRWDVWKIVCNIELNEASARTYSNLSSYPSKFASLIRIDIPRTFPERKVFDETCQDQLFRILNAYANYNTSVGYCQGMNFVAGLLLLVSIFEEQEAFWVFVSIMKRYELQGFYMEKFPLLKKYIDAFDKLSIKYIPELRSHFNEEGIFPPIYLHQWFLTLYVTSLPTRMVCLIWDFVLCDGLEGMLCITLALLKLLQRYLLQQQFEEIIKFFKNMKISPVFNNSSFFKLLIKFADKIHISSKLLKTLSLSDYEESHGEEVDHISQTSASLHNKPTSTPQQKATIEEPLKTQSQLFNISPSTYNSLTLSNSSLHLVNVTNDNCSSDQTNTSVRQENFLPSHFSEVVNISANKALPASTPHSTYTQKITYNLASENTSETIFLNHTNKSCPENSSQEIKLSSPLSTVFKSPYPNTSSWNDEALSLNDINSLPSSSLETIIYPINYPSIDGSYEVGFPRLYDSQVLTDNNLNKRITGLQEQSINGSINSTSATVYTPKTVNEMLIKGGFSPLLPANEDTTKAHNSYYAVSNYNINTYEAKTSSSKQFKGPKLTTTGSAEENQLVMNNDIYKNDLNIYIPREYTTSDSELFVYSKLQPTNIQTKNKDTSKHAISDEKGEESTLKVSVDTTAPRRKNHRTQAFFNAIKPRLISLKKKNLKPEEAPFAIKSIQLLSTYKTSHLEHHQTPFFSSKQSPFDHSEPYTPHHLYIHNPTTSNLPLTYSMPPYSLSPTKIPRAQNHIHDKPIPTTYTNTQHVNHLYVRHKANPSFAPPHEISSSSYNYKPVEQKDNLHIGTNDKLKSQGVTSSLFHTNTSSHLRTASNSSFELNNSHPNKSLLSTPIPFHTSYSEYPPDNSPNFIAKLPSTLPLESLDRFSKNGATKSNTSNSLKHSDKAYKQEQQFIIDKEAPSTKLSEIRISAEAYFKKNLNEPIKEELPSDHHGDSFFSLDLSSKVISERPVNAPLDKLFAFEKSEEDCFSFGLTKRGVSDEDNKSSKGLSTLKVGQSNGQKLMKSKSQLISNVKSGLNDSSNTETFFSPHLKTSKENAHWKGQNSTNMETVKARRSESSLRKDRYTGGLENLREGLMRESINYYKGLKALHNQNKNKQVSLQKSIQKDIKNADPNRHLLSLSPSDNSPQLVEVCTSAQNSQTNSTKAIQHTESETQLHLKSNPLFDWVNHIFNSRKLRITQAFASESNLSHLELTELPITNVKSTPPNINQDCYNEDLSDTITRHRTNDNNNSGKECIYNSGLDSAYAQPSEYENECSSDSMESCLPVTPEENIEIESSFLGEVADKANLYKDKAKEDVLSNSSVPYTSSASDIENNLPLRECKNPNNKATKTKDPLPFTLEKYMIDSLSDTFTLWGTLAPKDKHQPDK